MLLRLYNKNNNPKDLEEVIRILEEGGLIIYPTDTMYAIGCHGLKERAIERICKLKIVGSLKTLTIGKELEIRRTLSSSHLFSSAFVVDKGELKNGVPEWFLLTGAGWGHGVGLCQIGAAVMGERGYTYDEILLHYYKGADIRRFY